MKKIIVDILLFILMITEFSRAYLPSEIHEIIGILLIVLVVIHLILNRNYLKAIPKGKYNAKRKLMLIINVCFFVAFFLTVILGLLSSQNIAPFMNIKNLTTVYLHKILSYISLILLGLHLGMNLEKLFRKIEKNKYVYLIYAIIIISGIYSAIDVDFLNHLIGTYGFSITTNSILINSLEYVSIVVMITLIFHLILKIVKINQ